MGDIIDLATEDDLRYHFFPFASGYLEFKVRAANDAIIAFTKFPKEVAPMYEIIIGGWRNTKSVIRRNRADPATNGAEVKTPGILNSNEFRGFWVRWFNGTVSAGYEFETTPFLCWTDPEPFNVDYVGLCTGWGSTGLWRLEVSPVNIKPTHKAVKGGELRWVEMTDGKLPPDAIIGGFEDEPVYIARALHNGSMCPGKYVPSKNRAYVPWGHRAHPKRAFEILCGYNAEWVRTKKDLIPYHAFVAGTSEVNMADLYIGRAMHDGNLIPGKVHVLYKTCYLPYKGAEIETGTYEILVRPEIRPKSVITYDEYYPLKIDELDVTD